MRSQLRQILQQPHKIIKNRNTLQIKPTSVQQIFYQTLGNIHYLRKKQPISDIHLLLDSYQGTFSNRILKYKYMGFCMERKLADQYYLFNVLNLLSLWIELLQEYKKAPKIKFRQMLEFNVKYRGLDTFQDAIVYFHYIGIDLISLLHKDQKQKSTQSEKTQAQLKLQQQIHKKLPFHLDATDLLWFVNILIPKVIFNVIIPLDFFPQNFLPFSGVNIDLLYHNQNIEIVARSRPHYQNFLMTVLRLLIDTELEQSQTKQLLLQAFKYYYLFHYSKNLKASQIVIDCFKKVSPAVRFALSQQILLFFTILKKMGKQLYLNYLRDKFQWASELLNKIDDNSMIGNPKQGLKPSPMVDLPLVNSNQVPAGKKIVRYIQVYQNLLKMTLALDCITLVISLLKNRRDRENQQYSSSIEVVESGIYMMQFDNSYSWMKAKNVYFQYTILVPMQIIPQKVQPWIPQILFDKVEENIVPQQKILRVIRQSQGSMLWRQRQINPAANKNLNQSLNYSVKVTFRQQDQTYNIYIRRLDGSVYEYQSEDRSLLIKKIKGIKCNQQQKIDWFVNGIKADSAVAVIEQLLQQRIKYHQLDEEQQMKQQQMQEMKQEKQQQTDKNKDESSSSIIRDQHNEQIPRKMLRVKQQQQQDQSQKEQQVKQQEQMKQQKQEQLKQQKQEQLKQQQPIDQQNKDKDQKQIQKQNQEVRSQKDKGIMNEELDNKLNQPQQTKQQTNETEKKVQQQNQKFQQSNQKIQVDNVQQDKNKKEQDKDDSKNQDQNINQNVN